MEELEKINKRRAEILNSEEFKMLSTSTKGVKQSRRFQVLKMELEELKHKAKEIETKLPPKNTISSNKLNVLRPKRSGIMKEPVKDVNIVVTHKPTRFQKLYRPSIHISPLPQSKTVEHYEENKKETAEIKEKNIENKLEKLEDLDNIRDF
ncbi:MAG: hypothetical protein QW303_02395 [Nitrososphaerota archaeon]